ncbi:tyrosine-protein phosphatase [Burkholderia sp. BKH01]|uniref:tyrosine-protein phosphatase n=1 Tax=Burkholderia sp. BKH01 TaxID=2769262 RepID=UPI0021DFD729|nr:tyrosine-protein phosphatase [Burkholderia sp. BKH01]MCU9952091.1 tyrosine-protein phosphatase [Burkholderia sp. BKH01]
MVRGQSRAKIRMTDARHVAAPVVTAHEIGVNFRALADGAGVCHGIYRTGDVTAIDFDGARRLRDEFEISRYIDLRTSGERQRHGDATALRAAGIAITTCAIASNDQSAIVVRRPGSDAYVRYYLAILESMQLRVAELFSCIASMKGVPFLFGCHAGKDRTGLVAMLLLHACGASAEVIAQDYQRSGPYLLRRLDRFRAHWESKGETRDDYAVRLLTRAETMRQVICELNTDHGGVGGYLTRSGVAADDLRSIRHHYANGQNGLTP